MNYEVDGAFIRNPEVRDSDRRSLYMLKVSMDCNWYSTSLQVFRKFNKTKKACKMAGSMLGVSNDNPKWGLLIEPLD